MEGHAELLALQRLDETSAQLQRQGNYLEALECMERALVLRQHFFGADSEEVWNACKTVGEMCNLLAMTYLQQEDFAMVLELLKKAEILTERDDAGKAVTFNNLACYYRRQGKLHTALQYLQKALKIEARLSTVQNPADTHLNACAVLSQLGRHQSALEHAQNALILLQEELFSAPGAHESQTPRADRISVLAIAYHNLGVEQEFLKRYEQSLLAYRKGVEFADRYLGNSHAITITLRNSLIAARRAATVRQGRMGKTGRTGRRGGNGRQRTGRGGGGAGGGATGREAEFDAGRTTDRQVETANEPLDNDVEGMLSPRPRNNGEGGGGGVDDGDGGGGDGSEGAGPDSFDAEAEVDAALAADAK